MRIPARHTDRDRFLASALLLIISAVAGAAANSTGSSTAGPDPRLQFFEQVAELCGSTYEGQSSFPADPDDAFAGKLLVAHVASCTDREIRIPFAVGEDHSRTWILTWSDQGLLLKHDHRHADGTPDEVTMYGGWADTTGNAWSQSFAADDHTRELIPAAVTNVWTITLDPQDATLTYYLERHAEPRFKATLTLRSSDAGDLD